MRVWPSRRRFLELARGHDIVPVTCEVVGDCETPVSAFLKLGNSGAGFLLESVEGGEQWGRYSILGVRPFGRFRAFGRRIVWEVDGKRREYADRDPFVELQRWFRGRRPVRSKRLPRFFGGAVGVIDYDAVRHIEKLPDRHGREPEHPQIDLLLVQDLVVFDNLSHTLQLVACARIGRHAGADYDAAIARLDWMRARLAEAAPAAAAPRRSAPAPWREQSSRGAFERSVRRAQAYIEAGDVFQVVLSHELRARSDVRPLDIYRALRNINPSPYMFCLDFADHQVVGASPEVLARVEDGQVDLRPIAGTRRRGRSEREDQRQIAALLADPKERAEHVMLVDLGRNDLGRVCEFASVQVRRLLAIERYSHVVHLVSDLRGRLREGMDCFDAFRACFPAGTVSGAPKIRAMEIIDELETRRRGIYAGAVGYFSFDGSMDTCIAIRTLSCRDGELRLGVGAGIVLDSRPEREWEETQEKAAALRAAVERARRGLL